jgi:hypothetical protein
VALARLKSAKHAKVNLIDMLENSKARSGKRKYLSVS